MKKRNYNDLEPHMSYDSRPRRIMKRHVRAALAVIAVATLATLFALRFARMAACASAHGFYVSDRCTTDQCCEKVTPIMNRNNTTL